MSKIDRHSDLTPSPLPKGTAHPHAKWPVVIPINTATMLRSRERFVHRADDNTLHWVIGDVVPPELHAALETDDESLMRERERLWYVACTRPVSC